ncbi:MAG: hypothetical protein GY839_10660 [candidate division Zixibacteria bacterium]|nr:hypothetical protein [candidate division Zixibacteria bacterium]
MRAKKKPIKKEKLPPNPKIKSGVKLIYLGNGKKLIRGKSSGLKYYVSNQRRYFKARSDDVDQILRNRSFILEP